MDGFKVYKVGLKLTLNTDLVGEHYEEIMKHAWVSKVRFDEGYLLIEADIETTTDSEGFVQSLRNMTTKPKVELVLEEVDPEYDWLGLGHQILIKKNV